MLLGGDHDAHGGGPARDEQGSGHSGDTGTQASWPRGLWGCWGEPALRPGHDHAEPGYAPLSRTPQRRLRAFLRMIYSRSLISQP
jgi:hypothetical protein